MMKLLKNHCALLVAFILFLSVRSGYSQCSASYSVGYGPNGIVTCVSTSTAVGTINGYNWNFGGYGSTPSGTALAAVTTTFNANGIYTISLIIFTSLPTCTNQIIQTVTVTNVTNPACNLSASVTVSIGAGGYGNFNNSSTGISLNSTYTLNFGDSSPAGTFTSGYSQHTYSNNGTYVVTLTASNNYTSGACISTYTLPVTVNNICNLSPNFTLTAGSNGIVFFSNTTTTTSATTYTLNWGDGSPSAAVTLTASHTYSSNNVFPVTLFATNATCTRSLTQTFTVTNLSCTLSPSFNLISLGNGTVSMISTSIGTTAATSYSIYWGDSTPASTVISAHHYTANGAYLITLVASNSSLCTFAFVQNYTVNTVCNLVAQFSMTPAGNGFANFSNVSTGTNAATTYTVNWGDGGPVNGSYLHQFPANGTYTVIFFASNPPSGCNANTAQLYVVNDACNLSAGFNITAGSNGSASYVNTTTGTTSATTYTINWGDGGPVNGANPHVYTANGIYTVTLLANNNPSVGSCASSAVHTVSITNYCAPMTPDFTYSVGAYGQVVFNSTSTGTTSSTSYQWYSTDFPATSAPNNFASGPPSAQETFTANGNYAVTLTIYNTATPSCSFTVTHTLTITNAIPPCNASFTYAVGSGNAVTFLSTSTGTTGATTFTWNYGDLSSGSGSTSMHTYSAGGIYSVGLVIHDAITGHLCSATQTIFIPCNLAADFSHTVSAGGHVSFVSVSTGTASPLYTWHFGDGTYTNGDPVNHIYSADGAYHVALIVNDGVCIDSTSQSVNITGVACAANANFTLTPSGIPQMWNATPIYPWNVAYATWSWGDGSSSNTLYTSHTYSAAGNYSICLTVILTCGDTGTYCAPYYLNRSAGTDGIIYVNVLPPSLVPTGISPNTASDLDYIIYPNPNNGSFNISLDGGMASGSIKINVYNLIGEQVYESEGIGAALHEIHLDEAPGGIYFVRISSENQSFTKKLIINK